MGSGVLDLRDASGPDRHAATAWVPDLAPVDLPPAPPVTRSQGRPYVARRGPAWALVVLGAVLVVAPVLGGMFTKTAAGQQMIGRFTPYMRTASLSRYATDLTVLQRGTAAVQSVYRVQSVPSGAYPGLDSYRRQGDAIDARAQSLLDRIDASRPDFERVAAIGGFDRVPFLLVFSGLVFLYGGAVLLAGRRTRGRGAAVLVMLTAAVLIAYPFLSGLSGGAGAGQRMLRSFAPVMQPGEVRHLQSDFVVLVTAVGELDTGFRHVARPGPAADDLATLDKKWPTISSDFASLVGVINDDIVDFRALKALNDLPHGAGVAGFAVFPWLFVAVGVAAAGLSATAWPRRRGVAA